MLLAVILPAQDRPELFLREDWKETPAATPVTQQHVANPELTLSLHGPGKDGIKKSHHDRPADDPYYIWMGTCAANCAISLRRGDLLVDLTGLAKIRWRSKQSGYRQLRIVLKQAGGGWLVSDTADWRRLNIQTVIEGAWEEKPDLARIEEIGWTDLMTGGSSPASSRVDWIEVYGKTVRRQISAR
jgi:hypothetical protein